MCSGREVLKRLFLRLLARAVILGVMDYYPTSGAIHGRSALSLYTQAWGA